jgi:hypothetical protein
VPGAVILAGSIESFFVLRPTAEQVCAASDSNGERSVVNDEISMLRPAKEAGTSIVPAQPLPRAEAMAAPTSTLPLPSGPPLQPPTQLESSPPPSAPPAMADPPANPRSSAAEIMALLARGNEFLSVGDITSARLYYERAADAGSGLAALQLGATFDPVTLGRAGIRGVTVDPAKALSWYRSARALGVSEADQRIKSLEIRQRN